MDIKCLPALEQIKVGVEFLYNYINDSLQHKYLPDMSKCLDNCAEVVSLESTLKNGKKALICCIYRAPKTELEQLN